MRRRQTQGPPPSFYPAAAQSSQLTIKEELHLYSPEITFGPLKATERLMGPLVEMSRYCCINDSPVSQLLLWWLKEAAGTYL